MSAEPERGGCGWPPPVLLGIARIGSHGEVVLPQTIRDEAGLRAGSEVLLMRGSGRFGGLLLVEAERARHAVDASLKDVDTLRSALKGAPR